MDVPGTQVWASDTATGEALTFTTWPEQAPALRAEARAMADEHNRHHSGTHAGHGGAGAAGGMGGCMMMMGHGMAHAHEPPRSQAVVEDLPNGARIHVTPNDPADLGTVQSAVRTHASHLQQHGCAAARQPHR